MHTGLGHYVRTDEATRLQQQHMGKDSGALDDALCPMQIARRKEG